MRCGGSGLRVDINVAAELSGFAICPFCEKSLKFRAMDSPGIDGWKTVTLPRHVKDDLLTHA